MLLGHALAGSDDKTNPRCILFSLRYHCLEVFAGRSYEHHTLGKGMRCTKGTAAAGAAWIQAWGSIESGITLGPDRW